MAGESQQQIPRAPAHAKIPLHRNPRVRAFAFQALALGFVVWALWAIFDNTITNLESRGIRTGFDFMGQVAPFGFPENFFPFWDFKLGESLYIDVFVIGVQNTILISVLGVISATFWASLSAFCACRRIGSSPASPAAISKCFATRRFCCNFCFGISPFFSPFCRPRAKVGVLAKPFF